ncbi:hypothetical protein L484_027652 [Morus notabilis]|uniref:Uncharacterized protein n=1 Tax=Morus notabilis TaxID=981085 RepID=W9RCE3_9ROSA|nr:hypothetical protein L484_027652 [Morus notabilis]
MARKRTTPASSPHPTQRCRNVEPLDSESENNSEGISATPPQPAYENNQPLLTLSPSMLTTPSTVETPQSRTLESSISFWLFTNERNDDIGIDDNGLSCGVNCRSDDVGVCEDGARKGEAGNEQSIVGDGDTFYDSPTSSRDDDYDDNLVDQNFETEQPIKRPKR